MAEERTMAKRKALSIAGAALLALILLVPITNNVGGGVPVEATLTIVVFVALITFVVAAARSAWMYWRDWYRR